MAKIAYIIPGYEESRASRRAYDIIAGYFKSAGIKPVHVPIKWGSKKPVDFESYNKQFLKKYKNNKNDKVYILGFSFGAMIAFLTKNKTKPDAIIFCSLSPYFKEDYKHLKPSWLKFWQSNFTNEFVFNDIVKRFKTKSYFVAGDRESVPILKRLRGAKRKIKGSSAIVVKGARHNINNHAYLKAIEDTISKL